MLLECLVKTPLRYYLDRTCEGDGGDVTTFIQTYII